MQSNAIFTAFDIDQCCDDTVYSIISTTPHNTNKIKHVYTSRIIFNICNYNIIINKCVINIAYLTYDYVKYNILVPLIT